MFPAAGNVTYIRVGGGQGLGLVVPLQCLPAADGFPAVSFVISEITLAYRLT